MPASFEAFFLPAAGGQRLCVFHPAQGAGVERGAVIYVHPFAEEMNKSRRMAALQSRALARAGYSVLQIDLLGCGDSDGDFGDATWQAWVDDVLLGCRWLRARCRSALWLWGLRGGCLLAAQAAHEGAAPCSLLFWQPSTSGRVLLQQFLRVKVASDALAGQGTSAGQALRERMAAGETIEVAGYCVGAELARELEHASLAPCAKVERVEWIEIAPRHDGAVSPASAGMVSRWQASGCDVRCQVVTGPAFWQTTEIEEAPALLAATLASLGQVAAA